MSAKEPTRNPQQFPTIEPFLLLSPFSPRWFSLHRGFFLPSTGGFLQPVGESARWQLTQSPETATHWNNHPTNTASSGQIPPVTGRKCPQINFSAGRFLHRLEENGQNHTLQVSRFLQRVEETARRRDTLILHAHIRRGRYSGTRNSRHANSIRRIQSPLAGAAVLCRYP